MIHDIHKKKPVYNLDEKRQKLLYLMNSVFDDPLYKNEFDVILRKFNLDHKAVSRAFLDYNLDVYTHNNSIYHSQAIRIVLHMHNLIRESWHIERQEAVCRLLKRATYTKAIDMGFGVPSRYIRDMLSSSSAHVTLCDFQSEALDFAQELLNLWSLDWSGKVDFLCQDMEKVESCIGDYDLYISLHSIEHVSNPTQCLMDYVKLSRPDALFLIEIPIGPITPEHNISWANIPEAKQWIDKTGLEIIDDHITYVNPNVDLFADVHDFDYGGYLMLCQKKNGNGI